MTNYMYLIQGYLSIKYIKLTLYVNEKNNLALSFEKEVEMKKKSKKVLTLLLSVTILCSCENFKINQAGDFGDNSVVSEGVINSKSDNVVSEGAVNSEDYWERRERERGKGLFKERRSCSSKLLVI